MDERHLDPKKNRKQWSSEPAFVFSMAAAAVGLGNLWRFPYMVGENGGAAFIVAYLLALVVVAMPIMMLEVAAGRLRQGSVVTTYRGATRLGVVYGWAVVVLTIVITSYYLVITGWTLGYAVDALRLELQDFDDFTAGYNSVWYFLIVTTLAGLVLLRGVRAIEALSKLLMPLLVLMIAALVGVAATMPGWSEAVAFMTTWDAAALRAPELWFFAFGQAFYTLAIGQGYLVTYGSYIPRKTNVPRATLIVAATETTIALMAGWMIFPFVFSYGMDPGAGSELAFSTLPRVFEEMEIGIWLAIAFFGMFFAAAFSICLAGLKVIVAAFAEELRLSNARAVGLTAALMFGLGLPSALSFSPVQLTVAGMPFLDFLDQFGGTNVIIASGIIGAGLLCWVLPPSRVVYALGAKSRWWSWRIFIVGRSLPFAAVAFLVWRLVSGTE
ncbi:NSS family neurotransmitter:Na+ symporter [Roseinatronobacter thiooxidans]|uniref:Transporter n=1 Tax=Roseinatronobacter thiooxidans TaxID=121821 RepID=A0A2W7RUY7_9RHOB|nr:sodium-dependent transporter [Roseinatronobacter thiooxidans]PZX41942.1 NSS family neurotransmitter:Na+ symporter [Roseinatronobacter thiooxidans]